MSDTFSVTSLDEHPLRAFLDAAPNAVFVVDSDGAIAYANPVATEVFGYPTAELLGQSVEILLPHDRVAGHAHLRDLFIANPTSRIIGSGRHDVEARRKDGSLFPVETSLVPVEWHGHRLVVVTVTDITLRLEAELSLRQISRSYLTLSQMNQAIARATDASSLFAETCRIAVEQGGYIGAWVAQRGTGFAVVQAAGAGVLDDYVAQLGVTTDPDDPLGRGPTGFALREGRTYVAQTFEADEATAPWRIVAAGLDIQAAATLPIRQGGKVVASLILYSTEPHVFTDEVRALLEAMVDTVSFALDRFEAETRLAAVLRERTHLSQRLVAAQEAERARIAADMHDDSVQSLAALDLRLGLLKRQLAATSHEAADSVDELHRTVAQVSSDLRDLLFELEPAAEGQFLPVMLEEAAAHIFAESDCRWSMTTDLEAWDEVRVLSATNRGQSLRIVKEALFNIRRHSGATHVVVKVVAETAGVRVEVIDDGRGFEVGSSASAPGHRGLANMVDRALVAGGWCRIESGEAGGTTVRFWMPYDDSAGPSSEPTGGPVPGSGEVVRPNQPIGLGSGS